MSEPDWRNPSVKERECKELADKNSRIEHTYSVMDEETTTIYDSLLTIASMYRVQHKRCASETIITATMAAAQKLAELSETIHSMHEDAAGEDI